MGARPAGDNDVLLLLAWTTNARTRSHPSSLLRSLSLVLRQQHMLRHLSRPRRQKELWIVAQETRVQFCQYLSACPWSKDIFSGARHDLEGEAEVGEGVWLGRHCGRLWSADIGEDGGEGGHGGRLCVPPPMRS